MAAIFLMGLGLTSGAQPSRSAVVIVQANVATQRQVTALLVPTIAERGGVMMVNAHHRATADLERAISEAPLLVYVAAPSAPTVPPWIVHAVRDNHSAGMFDIGVPSRTFGEPGIAIAAGVRHARIFHIDGVAWPIASTVSVITDPRDAATSTWQPVATVTTANGDTRPYALVVSEDDHPWAIAGSWNSHPPIVDALMQAVNYVMGLHPHAHTRTIWIVGPIIPFTNLSHLQRVLRWMAQRHDTDVLAVNPLDTRMPATMGRILHRLQQSGAPIILAPSMSLAPSATDAHRILTADWLALVRGRVYPVALMLPNYQQGAWLSDPQVRFSTAFGTVAGATAPVVTKTSGVVMIPNPASVSTGSGVAVIHLMSMIDQRQITGDATVSLEIPNYISIADLAQITRELRPVALQAYPFDQLKLVARSPWATVTQHNGTLRVTILDPATDRPAAIRLTRAQTFTRILTWAIAVIVGAVVLQFLHHVWTLHHTRGRRLFRERSDGQGEE